jgi:hypothetical protein
MAKIRTTYCMRKDVIKLLEAAEEKTGIAKIRLLVLVVRKLLKNSKQYIRFSGRIKYQKRIDEETKLPIPKKRVKFRLWEGDYYYGHLYKPLFPIFINQKSGFILYCAHKGTSNATFSKFPYFQDMRRVFVLSISHVLAIAVFTYLEEVIDEILTNKNSEDEDGDNYPIENYAIIEKCLNNITTFHIW